MAVLASADVGGEGELTWVAGAVKQVVYAILTQGPDLQKFGTDPRYKVARGAWLALGASIVQAGFPTINAWTEPFWVQYTQGFYVPREGAYLFSRLRYFCYTGTTLRLRVES